MFTDATNEKYLNFAYFDAAHKTLGNSDAKKTAADAAIVGIEPEAYLTFKLVNEHVRTTTRVEADAKACR